MDFFKIFISFRYHTDIKLKILVSSSKHFRNHGIFKKWQIGAGRALTDILNTTFSLIISNNLWSWRSIWVCFLTQEIQKWHYNCPNTYWFWAIGKSYQSLPCGKLICKKCVALQLSIFFFFLLHCFKYYKLDAVKKWA